MSRFKFVTLDGKHEIPVYSGEEIPAWKMDKINQLLDTKYGLQRKRKDSDYRYNCHGLTFINKLGWIGAITHQNGGSLFIEDWHRSQPENPDVLIYKILGGNGFRLIYDFSNRDLDILKGNENIKIGDIVLYLNSSVGYESIGHSALVAEIFRRECDQRIITISVLSKMGHGGEYIHSYNDVLPAYGKRIQFWTDR
jgi:hypothetical protein